MKKGEMIIDLHYRLVFKTISPPFAFGSVRDPSDCERDLVFKGETPLRNWKKVSGGGTPISHHILQSDGYDIKMKRDTTKIQILLLSQQTSNVYIDTYIISSYITDDSKDTPKITINPPRRIIPVVAQPAGPEIGTSERILEKATLKSENIDLSRTIKKR